MSTCFPGVEFVITCFRAGLKVFTKTAAVWLRLNSAYGYQLPHQMQRPGTADNNLLLAGVAVWWWWWWWCVCEVCTHASKHMTTFCVSWIRRGFVKNLIVDWVLGFCRAYSGEGSLYT